MRHFNKLDWSISLSLLLVSVLIVIAACIQPSGPLGAPNVIQVGTVSSVRITLAQSALAPGQTTQATVVASSADGRVVAGPVDFSSHNPSVATVSSQGVVTALVAGAAMIHATVASRADSAAVIVKSLVSPVAVVAVALDSTSLGIGHSAKASATVTDSAGNLITGQTVTWASVSPTVATVSSTGAVTAVAAGFTTIQGTVSGKVGSASLTVIQVPALPVSVVAVQVDSTTLLVGHLAHASATAKDAMGNVITGQVVTWASLTPGIATVSSSGAVTAVAPGPAIIQGMISGTTGLDTIVVVVPRNLRSHDFNDGTIGPYAMVEGLDADSTDFPDDPTNLGHGKVARMLFNPKDIGGLNSNDEGVVYDASSTHLRYGQTIWMRGEVYLPSSGQSMHQQGDNRKLIDYSGAGVRMILHRVEAGGQLVIRMSIIDWMNGSKQEVMDPNTGIVLNDDMWHTIEVKMVTNSADNVRDGVLEIYMDGAVTPTFSQTTGLGWITEAYPGGSYFSYYKIGSQLTIQYPTDTAYSEYRYWDNVAFSTTRIGR